MGINKILAAVVLMGLLAGCTSSENAPSQVSTDSAIQTPESAPSSTTTLTTETPTPQESDSQKVSWELYPGLETKLLQLVEEKNCDGLTSIIDEYSNKEVALDEYLQDLFKKTGCS